MLQIHNLTLNYGTRNILNDINISIEAGNLIGLIGINGCGKSTLLKVINGTEEIDWGKIYTKGSVSVAYLSQDPLLDIQKWIKQPILNWYVKKQHQGAGKINSGLEEGEAISENDGFDLASLLKLEITPFIDKVETVQHLIDIQKNFLISQFRFFNYSDKELISLESYFTASINKYKKVFQLDIDFSSANFSNLSGGQLRKLGLILVISLNSNVLLLDEPTNHLDLESILSLEKIVTNLKDRSVIFVSHDRYFTDRCAFKMWELEKGKTQIHEGNYTDFIKNKVLKHSSLKNEIWKKQQYLKRELEWVVSGVKARGTKDKKRLDRFDEQKEVLSSLKDKEHSKLSIIISKPLRLGSKIVDFISTSFAFNQKYSNQLLWKGFSFSMQANNKIGILGANGCGKTTLLKLITDQSINAEYNLTGKIIVGINTKFLYYSQHKEIENIETTPLMYISNGRDYIDYWDGEKNKSISSRHYLKLWLFDKEKYTCKIKNLSGGEKSRLVLAKLFLNPANVIILDEPTNDLDLDTMMVLEQALVDYSGVVILISHDRTFLNNVCNIVWYFEPINKEIKVINGNWENVKKYYSHLFGEKNKEEEIEDENLEENKGFKNTSEKIQKKIEAKKAKEIKLIEGLISMQEKIVFDLQAKFSDPQLFSDIARISKIKTHLDREEAKLDNYLQKWEDLLTKKG